MIIRVTVWNENIHETTEPKVAAIYPHGIHGAIANGLDADDLRVVVATLSQPQNGLSEEVLSGTDVLIWWGHKAHGEVTDAVVDRVQRHVLSGMGLIVLHSGHFSRIFTRLMGTTCSLTWRNDGDRELIWNVNPSHPIASGIDSSMMLDRHETYSEFFDIPTPDELVFISSFEGGEVFRSGVTFTRGRGRIFYFSPGDQAYPIYFDPQIRRVIANAVRWAAPTDSRTLPEVIHSVKRETQ